MSTRLRRALRAALLWAARSPMRPRMGAVLLCGKRVVGVGLNSMRTHPFQARYGRNPHSIHIHAEVDCVLSAMDSSVEWEKCTLVVARLAQDGSFALARPCEGCVRLITALGIGKVYYTTVGGVEQL